MNEELAPGLTADWLNAWLAAIGITVLAPSIRLSWTDESIPIARFLCPERHSLASVVATALPDIHQLETLAIHEMPRQVNLAVYGECATRARQHLSAWRTGDFSLAASTTDLVIDAKWKEGQEQLRHSPFDPAAPGTTGSVYDRLVKCWEELNRIAPSPAEAIAATLSGSGVRVEANGLGFDFRRLAMGVHAKSKKTVDPVVECLCYFGLALFPVRGNGRRERPRGWVDPPSRRGAFSWPVWEQPLDAWGIDALLDRVHARPQDMKMLRRYGVFGSFRSVPYKPMADADTTRAYASERVPWR